MTVVMEMGLLPPVTRFFIGALMIVLTTGGSVLILHWLEKGDEE